MSRFTLINTDNCTLFLNVDKKNIFMNFTYPIINEELSNKRPSYNFRSYYQITVYKKIIESNVFCS